MCVEGLKMFMNGPSDSRQMSQKDSANLLWTLVRGDIWDRAIKNSDDHSGEFKLCMWLK